MNRRSAVFYAVMTLLMVAMTPIFNKMGGVFDAKAEACAAFLITIAPYAGYWTLAYGAAAGLLLDVQMSAFFGCNILFYCAFSFLAFQFSTMEKSTFVPCLITSVGYVCATWLFDVLIAFFKGFPVDFYAGLVKTVFPSAVLTAVITALFAWIMHGVHKSAWLRVRESSMGVRYR